MPMLVCLSQTSSFPSNDESQEVFKRLNGLVADSATLDRFGLAYAAYDRAFSLIPWSATASGPGGNALLFVDESYEEGRGVTLYAGLLMTPSSAFELAGWYLGNLITIRRQVPAFWPVDAPPPRLHFRELFNETARLKTTWRELPNRAISNFVTVVTDALAENGRVYPFVVEIPDTELGKALAGSFPGGVDEKAVPDLTGRIVAVALATAVTDNTQRGVEIDLVIDYDATKIHTGFIREAENALDIGGRRQTTLRFMEALRSAATDRDPRLAVDLGARHSSKFRGEFTWARLTTCGYSFTPIVEAIGLQFTDLLVSAWRHFHYGAYPQLRLSRRVLARAKRTEYFWAPNGLP